MQLANYGENEWVLVPTSQRDGRFLNLSRSEQQVVRIPKSPTGRNILQCMTIRQQLEDSPISLSNSDPMLPPEMTPEFFGEFPPLSHQVLPLAKMCRYKHYALFLEMGLGKTFLGIQLMRWLVRTGDTGPFLVLCPRNVIYTWAAQIEKYAQGELSALALGDDMSVSQRHQYIKMSLMLQHPQVLIASTDTFSDVKSKEFEYLFDKNAKQNVEFGCVIVDESTKIRYTNTERFKGVFKIRNNTRRKYIFTGFPSPQSPADYIGQCAFLHPFYLGYNSNHRFTEDYAVRDNYGRTQSWTGLERLKRQLAVFATSIQLTDTDIKLPDRVYKTLAVKLSPDQAKIYDALALEYIAYVQANLLDIVDTIDTCDCEGGMREGDEAGIYTECMKCKGAGVIITLKPGHSSATLAIVAQNAMVKLLRMSQITGGWAVGKEKCPKCHGSGYVEGTMADCSFCKMSGEIRISNMLQKNPKMDALEEFIEGQVQKPYVIFTFFRHEIQHIAKKFGLPVISGGTPMSETQRIIADIQAGRTEGVVIQPDAGGIGIDGLQVCKTAIYYSNSLKLESRLQSEKRLHRIGQQNTVTIVDLTAVGTVDEQIASRLQAKKDMAMEILTFPNLVKRK